MDYSILDFLSLLGAVCLFLYGMKIMSEGLQKAAGDRLRNILSAMTRNRFAGTLTGFSITALIQSSSASTVMVVSFVNAGLMTIGQSIAVIMGANVGTTATAWILTLFGFKVNISSFAIPMIAFALPLLFSSKSKRKSLGETLLGFAFLFMGLDMINQYVPDLRANPEIFEFLSHYSDMGFGSVVLFLLVGLAVTLVIQSSSATFAIVLIMCSKGWITFPIACALVLGSNIGTTVTPLIASLSGNVAAKRAALSHLLFNVLGTVWCLALFYPFIHLNEWITSIAGQGDPNALYSYVDNGGTDAHQIASMQLSVSFGLSMFHTVFNLVNLSIMIWFTDMYVKIVEKIMPAKHKEDEEFQLKFISRGLLSASELNISQAEKEIVVYAERVQRMIEMSKQLLHTKENSEEFNKIFSRLEKYEEISDRMEIEIANYLNRCAEGRLSNEGKLRIASMLRIVSEIESIADGCFGVAKALVRKQQSNVHFNSEIYDNIDTMFGYVADAMSSMLLILGNVENVHEQEIIGSYNKEREINNFRNQLRSGNIENINSKKYEYQAGIHYMDIIGDLEKTGDYIINVVDAVKELVKKHKE
ncbi:MAG: Na/Pi cotransporter family protein [Muribaculaceae bacterium]|nr:Na/Pi cotransporter family protein [Muribaculaceae bacterium]